VGLLLFARQLLLSHATFGFRTMQEIVNSFKIGMNEVTLTAERANGMKVKNFVRGVRGGKWCARTRSYISGSAGAVGPTAHTEVNIPRKDFQRHNVLTPVELIFNLGHLKVGPS
jgi:hypothetical protein